MSGALLCLSISACKGSAEITVAATSGASGTQQWFADAYAKASNTTAAYQYGSSVAIDGNRAVIGSPQESTSGAVYVLRNDGTGWVEEALLKAGNADGNDNFGFSVAISGDTLVVGATTEQGNVPGITNGSGGDTLNGGTQIGAVYVYRRSGTTWSQEAYIKAANANVGAGIFFGYAVSISGDTIAVGAPGEQSNSTTITNGTTASSNNSAPTAGAVFVYKRTGVNWIQEAYIKAVNSQAGDRFGQSVAIDSDTIAVGANNEDNGQIIISPPSSFSNNEAAPNAGAAYIFKRIGVNWALEAYLKAPNAEGGDQFGYSIALSGDTVAVGAIGESSDSATIINGAGASSNNIAAGAGAVYVLKRSGSTWNWEAYLKPPNTEASDRFGYSLAISGDAIAVGADQEDSNLTGVINGASVPFVNGISNSGAAYAFRRTGVTWAHEAFFKAGNPDVSDNFGGAVAISGNALVVGSRNESYSGSGIAAGSGSGFGNGAASSGAGYFFIRKSTP